MPVIDTIPLSQPIGWNGGTKLRSVVTSSAPNTTDFPDKTSGWHKHSSTGAMSFVVNNGGVLTALPSIPIDSMYASVQPVYLSPGADAASCLSRFKAAITALNTVGYGILVIDGTHTWPEIDPATGFAPYIGITGAIEIRFTKNAKIVADPSTTNRARLDFGHSLPTLTSGTAITGGIKRYASDFADPGGLAAGDYVMVWSSDDLTVVDVTPDDVGAAPGETRRVMAIQSGRVILDEPVCDAMTSSPFVKKFSTTSGIRMYGGRMENITTVFAGAVNSVFRDMEFINCGTIGLGAVNFAICYNCHVIDSNIENFAVAMGIGTSFGMASQSTVTGTTITGTGHAVTTTRGKHASGIETGGAKCVKVHQCTINAYRTASGGNQPLDTHCMGWGVHFDNNDVYLVGYESGGAITAPTSAIRCRARNVVATNNRIFAMVPTTPASAVWGVTVDGGKGAVLKGNRYNRVSGGIYFFDKWGGHTVEGEAFAQLNHVAIRIDGVNTAEQTRIKDVVCRFHTGTGFSSEPKSFIWTKVASVSGAPAKALITGCDLTKSGNTGGAIVADATGGGSLATPADGVIATNNYCYGYGSGQTGISGSGIGLSTNNYTD